MPNPIRVATVATMPTPVAIGVRSRSVNSLFVSSSIKLTPHYKTSTNIMTRCETSPTGYKSTFG